MSVLGFKSLASPLQTLTSRITTCSHYLLRMVVPSVVTWWSQPGCAIITQKIYMLRILILLFLCFLSRCSPDKIVSLISPSIRRFMSRLLSGGIKGKRTAATNLCLLWKIQDIMFSLTLSANSMYTALTWQFFSWSSEAKHPKRSYQVEQSQWDTWNKASTRCICLVITSRNQPRVIFSSTVSTRTHQRKPHFTTN